MSWKVYMLRLPRNCIYVGCTNDLERRLSEHRGGTGSRITSEALSLELIYTESFPDCSSAQKRERQLKRWTRAKKLAVAAGRLDELRRLARSRQIKRCEGGGSPLVENQ